MTGDLPVRRPTRRNAFVQLYDVPLYRDWAAWLTLAMLVITPLALGTGDKSTSNLPRWADVLLGTPVMTALFGVLPAAIRLGIRAHLRSRRQSPSTGQTGTLPEQPVARTASPSEFGPTRPVDVRKRHPSPLPPSGTSLPVPVSDTRRIADLQPSGLASAHALTEARTLLQFPIASAARSIQLAPTLKDEYEEVLRGCEAMAIVLGVCLVTATRPVAADKDAVGGLRTAFLQQGVSIGHWLNVIDSCVSTIVAADGVEVVPGMLSQLRRSKKVPRLSDDLRSVAAERNRWAHGAGPRTNSEAGARLADLAPVVERAFDRLQFLTGAPWLLVRSSSYRRGRNDFSIGGNRVMSDHPDFERADFFSPTPLANDTVYMMLASGPVDLTPFVVVRDCPECHQSELCYADKVHSHGVGLKSFARGHVIYDDTLVPELEQMFLPPLDQEA